MCLNKYKLYPSNTKVFSRIHAGRMLQSFKCGHCAECLEQKRKEWYFRAVYEFDSTVKSNGYMLFDTLTYRPSDVPRVSRYYSVPRSLDYMCFDHADTTNFLKLLRIRLERDGYDVKDNLRYFYSTEYGTDPNATHRPHIHFLFYVRNSFIEPILLSRYISECWSYGRTDGVDYKGKKYVLEKNVIKSDIGSSSRICKYVSKYVVKSLSFDSKLDKCVNRLMWYFFDRTFRFDVTLFDFGSKCACGGVFRDDKDAFFEFCASPRGKRLKASIKRCLDMYHRQSVGFGLSALDNIDVDSLIDSDTMIVRDCGQVVMRISVPTYYKRKLFYEKTDYRGSQCWQLNALGIEYNKRRHDVQVKRLQDHLDVDVMYYGVNGVDTKRLANYLMDERGLTDALCRDIMTIDNLKINPEYLFYSYSTPSDVQRYKHRYVTNDWYGSAQVGYVDDNLSGIAFDDFVARYCLFDKQCEDWINSLEIASLPMNRGRDEAYKRRQSLTELYKSVFS